MRNAETAWLEAMAKTLRNVLSPASRWLAAMPRVLASVLMLISVPAFAGAPSGQAATETLPAPDQGPAAPPSKAAESGQKAAPGGPGDASIATVELPPRLVARTTGKAEWASGFKSIIAAITTVEGAITSAGMTQTGRPFVVFLSTDDTSFEFEAMVPIAEIPQGSGLTDHVKIGQSPPGRAIKFLHRGAYDDIDSTYDLITALLDEKGLEAQNVFIEEYLTDTKEADDPNLEADIYVLLK
jgi:effector-binding domain-containing protein